MLLGYPLISPTHKHPLKIKTQACMTQHKALEVHCTTFQIAVVMIPQAQNLLSEAKSSR
jgi:hypothetical protein